MNKIVRELLCTSYYIKNRMHERIGIICPNCHKGLPLIEHRVPYKCTCTAILLQEGNALTVEVPATNNRFLESTENEK